MVYSKPSDPDNSIANIYSNSLAPWDAHDVDDETIDQRAAFFIQERPFVERLADLYDNYEFSEEDPEHRALFTRVEIYLAWWKETTFHASFWENDDVLTPLGAIVYADGFPEEIRDDVEAWMGTWPGNPLDGSTDADEAQASNEPSAAALPSMDDLVKPGGLLYGTKLNEKRTWVVSRDAKWKEAFIFGHNGLEPGQWFFTREQIKFHGGHYEKVLGVQAKRKDKNQGAFAVVVGEYKSLNVDNGDVVYYAGTGANTCDSLDAPPNNRQTKALHKSITTKQPIRLFRGPLPRGHAAANYPYAPAVGFRYDGLYEAVGEPTQETRQAKNKKGEMVDVGLYERFKLVRLKEYKGEEQISLNECKNMAPNDDHKEAALAAKKHVADTKLPPQPRIPRATPSKSKGKRKSTGTNTPNSKSSNKKRTPKPDTNDTDTPTRSSKNTTPRSEELIIDSDSEDPSPNDEGSNSGPEKQGEE